MERVDIIAEVLATSCTNHITTVEEAVRGGTYRTGANSFGRVVPDKAIALETFYPDLSLPDEAYTGTLGDLMCAEYLERIGLVTYGEDNFKYLTKCMSSPRSTREVRYQSDVRAWGIYVVTGFDGSEVKEVKVIAREVFNGIDALEEYRDSGTAIKQTFVEYLVSIGLVSLKK